MDLILYFYFLDVDPSGKLVNPHLSEEFDSAQLLEVKKSYDSLKDLLLDVEFTSPETLGWKYQIKRIIEHPCTFNPNLSEIEILKFLSEYGNKSVERIKKFLRRIEWDLDQKPEQTFELREQKRAIALAMEYCEELKKRLADKDFAAYKIWDFVKGDSEYVNYGQRERLYSKSLKLSKKTKADTHIELPNLETVLVSPNRLPDLWRFLVKKQGAANREFFDSNGYAGSDDRNASPLMGLAIGLRLSHQIKGDFNEKQVYQILCKQFNVTPTKERHKTKRNANFTDVRDWVTEFFNE
jgi:hypothetical protein